MSMLFLDTPLYAQLAPFKNLWVAYSGGLDSTVLLHLLANSPYKSKLHAIHINHALSPNADEWQLFGANFCEQLGIPYHVHRVNFKRNANVEEHARQARYHVFKNILHADDCLLLGHHQNDQAETVLLQLFRGAGIEGLSAMNSWGELGKGTIARPLLEYARAELAQYAHTHHLQWIDDESNEDTHYSRNYLRHVVIPLIEQRWPAVTKNLARTAVHARSALDNLQALAHSDYPESLALPTLNRLHLEHLDEKRISNILRLWFRSHQIKSPGTQVLLRVIHELVYGRQDAIPEVRWGEITLRRHRNLIYLQGHDLTPETLCSEIPWEQFPHPLSLPHQQIIVAEPAPTGLQVPQHAQITIRFRQGGEKFLWHQQSKCLKKLFQEWNVPVWERPKIPLLYIDDDLAVIGEYAISDLFYGISAPAWCVRLRRVD